MQNEYGGCLYLETGVDGKDYYDKYMEHRIDVDSGRSALQYILENNDIDRIWLPVYNCPLVEKRIRAVSDVHIMWYNIDDCFRPHINLKDLNEKDAVLWVNYCGVVSDKIIDDIADWQNKTRVKIIIDNIPAYFSRPRMNVLNIYSCRKFIGVPDGGHIIGNSIKNTAKLPQYSTANNYLYLMRAMETGSNSVYNEYQESEKRFSNSKIAYGMPVLTQKILKNIDYSKIIKRRKENFDILHNYLNSTNRLKIDTETTTPSVYPYLTSDCKLREKLLDNKIYISRFWKHVLTNERANDFEKDLAEFLIPLPIDQRYNSDDMEYIAKKIKMMENKNE